jgi:hypothetical protein
MAELNRKTIFYFHYNKPYSKRYGTHKWSVHWRDTCYITDKIICNVPTISKLNKRQPYVVMRGHSNCVKQKGDTVTIY